MALTLRFTTKELFIAVTNSPDVMTDIAPRGHDADDMVTWVRGNLVA